MELLTDDQVKEIDLTIRRIIGEKRVFAIVVVEEDDEQILPMVFSSTAPESVPDLFMIDIRCAMEEDGETLYNGRMN